MDKTRTAIISLVAAAMLALWLAPQALAAPLAPSNLSAVIANSRQVNLTWQDNSTDEKKFRLERAGDAAFTSNLQRFTPNSSNGTGALVSFADNGVTQGQTYFYRVMAVDTDDNPSPPSNTVQIAVTVPLAPSNLAGVATGPTRVELTWSDLATNEASYRVDRSADANFGAPVSFSLPVNSTSFVDNSPQALGTYFYRVLAINAIGNSTPSNAVQVALVPPAAPGGLTATASGTSQIGLAWTDNSNNENGFRIERSASATAFAPIDATIANVTGFSDTSVSPGTTYSYRIIAFNGIGDSAESNTATVTTPSPPPPSTPPPSSPPPPPPSGGGGSSPPPAPANINVSLTGLTSATALMLSPDGAVLNDVHLFSLTGELELFIRAGTTILDENGKPVTALSATAVVSPPASPAGKTLVLAFELTPAGTRFNPSITLIFHFDPAKLPANSNIQTLNIFSFDRTKWVSIATTVDGQSKTASCQIARFGLFALFIDTPQAAATAAPSGSPKPSPSPTKTTPVTGVPGVSPAPAPAEPVPPPSTAPASPAPTARTSSPVWWLIAAVIVLALLTVPAIASLRRRALRSKNGEQK